MLHSHELHFCSLSSIFWSLCLFLNSFITLNCDFTSFKVFTALLYILSSSLSFTGLYFSFAEQERCLHLKILIKIKLPLQSPLPVKVISLKILLLSTSLWTPLASQLVLLPELCDFLSILLSILESSSSILHQVGFPFSNFWFFRINFIFWFMISDFWFLNEFLVWSRPFVHSFVTSFAIFESQRDHLLYFWISEFCFRKLF